MTLIGALLALTILLLLVVLVLMAGIIRRLRLHDERLTELQLSKARQDSGLAIGSPLPSVAMKTVNGSTLVSSALSAGPVVFGFFAVDCTTCEAQLPTFLAEGKQNWIAVINGPGALSLVGRHLVSGTHVVAEDALGPVTQAFNVLAFPTYLLAEDGYIADWFGHVQDLPREAPFQSAQ